MGNLNNDVTEFLDALNHPFRNEIELLRQIILSAEEGLLENIKWNAPNYCYGDEDRITMRIQPPKQIQLIFHRGAQKQEQPKEKLIQTGYDLLAWKENDRAVATFKESAEIKQHEQELVEIIKKWISGTT